MKIQRDRERGRGREREGEGGGERALRFVDVFVSLLLIDISFLCTVSCSVSIGFTVLIREGEEGRAAIAGSQLSNSRI